MRITAPLSRPAHADRFRIDLKTGQITVAPGAQLNAEGDVTNYYVEVTAIDGDEAPDSIAVTNPCFTI